MADQANTPEEVEETAEQATVAEALVAVDYTAMEADALKAAHEAAEAEYKELDAKRSKLPADKARMNELAQTTKAVADAWATLHEPAEVPSELQDPEAFGNRKREAAADEGEGDGDGGDAPADTPEAPAEPPAEKPADAPEAPAEKPADTPAPETPAGEPEAPAEPPTETPAAITPDEVIEVPDTPASLVDEKEPAMASNTPRIKVGTERRPFSMVNTSGKVVATAADLMNEFHQRTASRSRQHVDVVSFNPFEGNGLPTLTSNANENFRTLYGNDPERVRTAAFGSGRSGAAVPERTSFTAALNCAGPATPVMDIPFCYSDGRPLQDSGLIGLFNADVSNGQIQLYDCHQLPAVPELVEAGDCGDKGHGCNECGGEVECYSAECLVPADPMAPSRWVSCMCIPESMTFSNQISFDQAMFDFAVATDQMWETRWMEQLRASSLVRTVSGADHPEHGAHNTLIRSLLTVGSRMSLDCRCTNGLQDYTAFIPCGEALFYASMADKMSRVLGCECPGEDIVEWLTSKGVPVVFGLDADPNGTAVAGGFTAAWSDLTLGTPLPLEDLPNAGTIYLVPRDTFGTASPLTSELGFEFKDQCQVHTGCLKMTRAEWWFDLFRVGCKDAIVLDFTDLCASGTGPDLTVGSC